MALVAGVHGRDERIISVLEHIDGQTPHENFVCHMEVAEHCVAPPPSDQTDCVQVHLCDDQGHSV